MQRTAIHHSRQWENLLRDPAADQGSPHQSARHYCRGSESLSLNAENETMVKNAMTLMRITASRRCGVSSFGLTADSSQTLTFTLARERLPGWFSKTIA